MKWLVLLSCRPPLWRKEGFHQLVNQTHPTITGSGLDQNHQEGKRSWKNHIQQVTHKQYGFVNSHTESLESALNYIGDEELTRSPSPTKSPFPEISELSDTIQADNHLQEQIVNNEDNVSQVNENGMSVVNG